MSIHAPLQRRPHHPAITEELVGRLVDRFYDRIRMDRTLGPIFGRVIGEDWGPHLKRMKDFWSSIALMSGRYKGTPFVAHQRIGGLSPELFAHWLALWREAVADTCPPGAAEIFIDRAERIAESLQFGLFYRAAEDAPAASPEAGR